MDQLLFASLIAKTKELESLFWENSGSVSLRIWSDGTWRYMLELNGLTVMETDCEENIRQGIESWNNGETPG